MFHMKGPREQTLTNNVQLFQIQFGESLIRPRNIMRENPSDDEVFEQYYVEICPQRFLCDITHPRLYNV